jgi:hypothetical protein
MADSVVDMFYLTDPLYAEALRNVKIHTNGSGGGQSGFVVEVASQDPKRGNGDAEPEIKEKVKAKLESKYGLGFDDAFLEALPSNSKSNTGLLHPDRYKNLYQRLVKTEHIMKNDDGKLTFAELGDEEGRLPKREMKILESITLNTRTSQNLGQLAGRRRKSRRTRRKSHARKTRRNRK